MPEINPLTKDQLFEKKIAENTGSNYNVGDISDVVPVTKDQSLLKEIALNSAGLSEDITELEGKATANAEAIEATQDMISDTYDSTATYAVGDYCIYNDTLYKCNTAIVTGEAFTPAKWEATNVAEELGELTERVDRGSVSVTADGVKTYKQLLNELYSLATYSKIRANILTAILYADGGVLPLNYQEIGDGAFQFGTSALSNGEPNIVYIRLHDTNSEYEIYYDGINHSMTNSVPSGRTYTLYF